MLLNDLSNPSLILDPYGLHARNISLEFLGVNEQLPEQPPIIVEGSPGDLHARNISLEFPGVNEQLPEQPPIIVKGPPGDRLSVGYYPLNPTKEKPVGILGAGVGGLYTALILDSLNIPYKILEARDDVGGRLFTHHFFNTTGAPYNYFDVGAMRFPKTETMRRVFHLFAYPPLNTSDIQLNAKLREYRFSCGNAFMSYNGVTVRQSDNPGGDIFKASELILDTYSAPYIKAGINAIINDVIDPFARAIINDLHTRHTLMGPGWRHLMKYDKYSTRAYMALVYKPSEKLGLPPKHLSTDIINWLETSLGTGAFDLAFTEFVLGSINFGWSPDPEEKVEWYCIDGGSNQIAQCMAKYIRRNKPDVIQLRSSVTSIGLNRFSQFNEGLDVVTNHTDHHSFSHVICTIPLPVLRVIDLSNAKLTTMQSNALRMLNYTQAVKVGLQFKTAWWTTGTDKAGRRLNIVGGQTYTDRPLRTVVYPSYGEVDAGKTTTLIASYCHAEDGQRLSALINNDTERLSKIVLKELADIHNIELDFLQSELINTFGWSWSDDLHTMGAFAVFGPGKFKNVYTSMNTSAAGGLLHFAGEALSARHAWVEGALDSAWRAVNEMLWLLPDRDRYLFNFYRMWGYSPEWVLAQPRKSVPESSKTPWGIQIPLPPDGKVIPDAKDNLILQQLGRTHPEYFQ